eukprot:scaffold2806_cov135-Isochrysis_galbana.AAC.3
MQYVEIYNEVVKDLLDPAPKMTNLDVRENPRQGTFVAGAATLQVRDTPDRLHTGCSRAEARCCSTMVAYARSCRACPTGACKARERTACTVRGR